MRALTARPSISGYDLVRPTRVAAILLIAATLTACGEMTVSMEVLNPVVIERANDAALVASIPKLSLASDEDVRSSVKQLKAAHRKGYEKVRDAYFADAAKASGKAADDLRMLGKELVIDFDTSKEIQTHYEALQADLLRYRDDLKVKLAGRYTVSPSDPNYGDVIAILRTWQQRNRQALADVRTDIGKFVAIPDNSIGPLATSEAAAVTSTIGGQPARKSDQKLTASEADAIGREAASAQAATEQVSIQNSPYAYAVANADSTAWGSYNQVFTTGDFGATDVAIKLDPNTGNYLLKGLSFDPSDVAAIASKVTTQALLLSAQIAGVPVKSATAPAADTTGKALAASSGALADAQAELETRRAQDSARKNALIAIANVILNEEAELSSTDGARRKAAVTAIRNAFDTRQTLLRPPPTP